MSWHFSRALAEAYSQATCSDGEQSAPSNSPNIVVACSGKGSVTGQFLTSQFGTILEPSTVCLGEAALTWFREAFPARRIPRRLEVATSRMISGRKCSESWQRQLPGTYLPRILHGRQSKRPRKISVTWVTKSGALPYPRQTWVAITYGNDIGYVHTPTKKINYHARSMQKWPACRAFVQAFGEPTPVIHEWLMAWPIGWSALKPLETDKFQSWLRRHGD